MKSKTNWISVDDELPPVEVTVIVQTSQGGRSTVRRRIDGTGVKDKSFYVHGGTGQWQLGVHVYKKPVLFWTHWPDNSIVVGTYPSNMEPTKTNCIWPDCSYENCACDKKSTKVKIEDMNERQLLDAFKNVTLSFNSANPTSGAVDETTDTKKLAGLSSLKAEEHPLSQKPLIERITPGPWTYDKENQIVNARSMRGHGEFMLADIRGWGHLQYVKNGADIQDANGEAISRVPELLKAEQERDSMKKALQKIIDRRDMALKTEDLYEVLEAIREAKQLL